MLKRLIIEKRFNNLEARRAIAEKRGYKQYLFRNPYVEHDYIEDYYYIGEMSEEDLSFKADDMPWDRMKGNYNPLLDFYELLIHKDIHKEHYQNLKPE